MRNLGRVTDHATLISERIDELLAKADPATTDQIELRGLQYDLGLAWVHFPEGWGGLGAPPKLQREIDPRLYAAGELVGGLFYHNYPGGTGLVSGAVLGKVAGENAGKAAMAR